MTQAAFQNIIVGIDFSEPSRHALNTVRQRFSGARVTLLHVTDIAVGLPVGGDPLVGFLPYSPELGARTQEADAERLQDWLEAGEEAVNLQGEPVSTILKVAEDKGADLLVVGTHARGAIEHFFLGSTAEKLVARSPIPVLTVRKP